MDAYSYNEEREGLTFAVTSEKLEEDWYRCTVELSKPLGVLSTIDSVEYVMHKSFPDRIRERHDPDKNFRLKFECYEGFQIMANVHFKNGDERTAVFPVRVRKGEKI